MANETQIYVGKLGAQTLYKRLKQLIGRITTYKKVPADEQGNPIESNPDSRTIYLVKDESVVGEDKFFEWIWTSPNIWECIGTTSEPCNSWKQWSEDNGSSGEGDSVYIGKNNELDRDESYSLGKDNTVEVTDDTDYTDTDVVAIGTDNTATNAANAYQFGRENSVIDNNLAAKLTYPHSMALNLGRNNKIVGEGVNVGKDNDATKFGINIGQNNFSSNASCSVGQHVMADNASLSMGNAEQTLATVTVGNVPTLLVNGSYEHVQRFRFKEQYHYCKLATIYQDPADNKYKWADIQSTRLHIYPNYELDQYLVSWGSGSQSGTITGYYDAEGVFHESSDTSHNIHTYGKITSVGNPSGDSRVELNPPFYANYVNQEETRNYIIYVMRAEITLPAYGTILTRSEYETLIAGSVTPVLLGSISDLFINLDDLTADGYKVPGLTGTNALPLPLSYEIYGYKDNDVLIPYNELNKDETHDFDWYEVDRSDIKGNTLPVKQVNPRAERIVAVNRSATLGMGSLYASGRSITISTNSVNAYQMRYDGTYETNMYRTYRGTCYTINQNTGNYTTKSTTISCFTKQYGGSFTSNVAPYCASADGASIVISNEYGTAYGSSVAIGNYANADGFSYVVGRSSTASSDAFAFGNAAFGYNHSMALGFDNSYATRSSLSFGMSGVGAYDRSVAIGFDGITSQNYSLAIACGGYANGKSMIFGFNNNASNDAIAIGRSNSIYQEATGLGANNVMYYQNIAIGYSNNMQNTSDTSVHATLIGTSNTTGPGGYNIGIGENNVPSDEAIAIGRNNRAYGWSIALGVNNTSYDGPGGHATMIGQSNTSTSNQEVIHKEYQIYIYNEPTQEQIDKLNEREAAYRRLIDPYLDSEMRASLNTYDAGNNDYYLGRSDEMAWGYYSYFSWLQTLGNQPPFIFSSSDKAALDAITQQQPQTVEDYKTLILQICGIVQNYANVDELRTLANAATTIDDLNAIWSTQLWRDIGISMQWSGDPIPGVVSDYDVLPQILVAYRSWNEYGLSLRSSVAPHYETIEEDVVCNSFLVGNNNTSNHYNSILIGSLNESQAPLVQPDATDHTTDDDGFVLAIGYRNVVGRNYDIAIGHKSTANGGENVAIQHSVAGNGNNTFHNLAMFNSTAYGTGNVALQDSSVTDGFTNFAMFNSSINGGILNIAEGNSTLDVGKLVGTSSAQNVYANMLSADSRLVNVATSSIEHMQKNRLFSSNVDTCQRMGYNDFFVSNVNFTKNQGSGIYYNLIACNGRFENSGDRRPIPFVVDVPTYHNNILFGNRSGSISVTEFNRNVVLQPRDNDGSYWMNWNGTQAADNFLFGHQVQGWFGGDGMYDNVIMNSRLTGSIDNEFVQNVMLARSIVKVNTTDNVTQSFLFNAGLTLDDTLRKTQTHSTQNALFNCTVKNSSQVFVFGFGDDAFDSEYTEYQSMNCTWRTVAFGDNKVDETCDSFLFGSDNRVEYTHETTVFGRMNNLLNYSIDDYGKRDYVKMGGNKVVGSKNELTNDSGELSRSIVIGDSNSIFAVGKTNDNKIIGSNNTISGGSDTSVTVTNPKFVEEFTEKTFFTSTSTGCINTGDTQSYVNSPYGSSSYFYYLYSNGYLSGYQWDYAVPDSVKYTAIEKSTTQLRNDYSNGVLSDGMWYKVPGGQSSASFSQPIVKGFVAWKGTSYYFDGETVRKVTGYSSGARYTYRNTIIGTDNYLGNNVSDYFILGKSNKLTCNDYLDHETDYTISTGFIQGNNNVAKNGSNIVCIGNGNVSTGHNSTAIGTQLISSQWQTVIGKYNAPIDGATRLDTENPQDPTKALFIIGNGYSQKDDETYWQDESYITRSNAMVVYADGTVRAKKFVSDAPDLELVNGTGITFTDSTSTNTRTVSVSQDLADLISFLDTRPSTGRYAINSINGVLTWVEIGTTGV
jgi:hypothetical protein